jgi:hypothetical protein
MLQHLYRGSFRLPFLASFRSAFSSYSTAELMILGFVSLALFLFDKFFHNLREQGSIFKG